MKDFEITNETPLVMLNVGQFKSLQNMIAKPVIETRDFATDGKEYVFGLSGLMRLINCSRPTAQALKNSGRITYIQTGRKLVFDKNLVLKELQNNKALK